MFGENFMSHEIPEIPMKNLTLSPMKNLTLGFCLVCPMVFGQLVVSNKFVSSSGTQMAITDDLKITNDEADFSNLTLSLSGTSQDLTVGRSSSTIALGGLIVGTSAGGNGGTKNLIGGTWEVNGEIVFNDGIVVPQTSSGGKLVHTIANGTTASVIVNNPDSYFNGTFYSKGKGIRFFPIGNSSSGSYYPAQINNVVQDVEIGMRVVNSNAGLTHGSEILSIFEEQYWEVLDPSNSLTDAFISLSTLGAGNYIDPNIGTAIIGGPAVNGAAVSLEGAPIGDFIVGGLKFKTTERVFTLAKVGNDQVAVKIRNVITPLPDNANDYLEIENIHLFPDNKVTMLDRWGVKVKEWSAFANVDGVPDPKYDLSKVPTGNYIVIVEYKDGSKQKQLSQMVTLINQ